MPQYPIARNYHNSPNFFNSQPPTIMTTLGIILARAGSKGLPQKNALPVAGKPMLAWTIEHAKASRTLDHVILSTDGQELKAIGRMYDLTIIDRPADLAGDTISVDAAARHAVDLFEKERSLTIDNVAILYGNIPVRPADLTDQAMTMLRTTGADSVQSVSPVGKMHPYWMRKLTGSSGDQLEPWQPNHVYRRQDLPVVYMLNGGIIALTRRSLQTTDANDPHAFLGSDRRGFAVPQDSVVDVDSEIDLFVAEKILSMHKQTTYSTDEKGMGKGC